MLGRLLGSILLLFIIVTCSNSLGDNKPLGNNYLLLADGKYTAITYRIGPSSSLPIIYGPILNYAYNQDYIIVENIPDPTNEEGELVYWIIDKNVPIDIVLCDEPNVSCDSIIALGLQGPMDSINFAKILKEQNIDISFSDQVD